MKTKSFVFAFFLCALIFISVVAIESSKEDEKQPGAFENSKIKLGVNHDRRLREGRHGGKLQKRHSSEDLQFWINGGGWGGSIESGGIKGSINIGGVQDGGENIELGGQEKGRNEVSLIGKETKETNGFEGKEVENENLEGLRTVHKS
ncbi:unnamed protein product [Vicia faba]|uniref:Nodule-specific Glycine Rich Peptide n=1 Tax=Vicia faba TaxID=3906 RepID=A0AAV0YNQ2_VICFA|nr:unnamed protein product [Vicia faba]